jgi:hypothetical protein
MLRNTAAAFALALATLSASGASAQMLTAGQPAEIANELRNLGYRAELSTDSDGDPIIRIGVSGINSSIFFYGCDEKGQNCDWIQFYSSFNTDTPSSLSSANEWNRTKLFGEMTVADDGDPTLTYFVSLDGGMTPENFADVVDWWELAVGQFTDYINW